MLKYFLFFSFFLCLQTNAQSNRIIDSLLIEVKKENHDTILINQYFTIGSEYVNIDPNKSDFFSKLVLKKSKKINYKKGFAQYHYLNAKQLYASGQFEKSKSFALNGKKYISNKQSDIYLDLSYIEALSYLGLTQYNKSIAVAQSALKILRSDCIHYAQIGRLNYTIAASYSRNNQMEEALKMLPIAISNFRKANNINGELNCYIELHDINYLKGNDDKAHKAILEALRIYKHNNLNSKAFLVSINYKLGESFSRKNQFNEAIKYFKNALDLNQKLNNSYEKVTILGLLAEAYCYSKQYRKCIETVNKIRETKLDDELGNQFSYFLKAKSYYGLNKYELAKKNIDSAIVKLPILKRKGNEDYNEKDYYQISSLIEYELGNYKEAYLNANKYSEIEIEDLKSDKAKRVEGLQEQFESKEKDLKLKNILLHSQKKELESLKSKKRISILSIVIFLLSVGVILFCIFYRIKIKNNLLLQKKNNEIERKNSDLLNAKDSLRKLLLEKQILLKEIHHRVKNNLQLVGSLLNIQSRVSRHPIVDEFICKSQSRIISMSLIHQNLYNTEEISHINFQEYLEDLVSNLVHTFNNKLIKVTINSSGYYFDIQTAIPLGLIINEVLCNSLKHAFYEGVHGEIVIDLKKTDETFTLTIGDNGKGMDDKKKRKDAIGMDLVELLIMQLKATICKVESKGTKYEIKFYHC